MQIESIGKILPNLLKPAEAEKNSGVQFENVFSDFIGEVNKTQLDANKITGDFLGGKNVELHEVMIAGEKAKTSFELLMEIRNKAIDMYKELSRMSA
ncbi:MAG: flagellar hook-basal body complex protein FliE [Ignavibacteriaceae bacterium]|jgi:flagellar hook-basal body complex protein FliE|nr:flagellar hook-basal body complex protein FliE [Ignavibacteriaceae bacterium]